MEEKIKIAYLDYSPHFAGAESALCTIIKNINKEKYDITIFFPYPKSHHCRYDILDVKKRYLYKSIKWWMGRERWKKPFRGMDFLMRSICGIKLALILRCSRTKILHINLLRPDSLMWIAPARVCNIKVIGHYRSLPWEWVPSQIVLKHCNTLLCVSKIVKERVDTRYKHPSSFVVYDAIDSQLFECNLSSNEAKEALGFNKDALLISSVGALFPVKGHDNAIRAFAQIAKTYPQTILFIAGGGNPSELSRLKKISQELHSISNRIFFSENQLSTISLVYKASDIILSLTKEGEAFGLVPFEAALFKIPVIAPNQGAIIELLENNKSAFFVNTQNLEDISTTMKLILDNPTLNKDICEEAYKYTLNMLSPQKLANRMMEVYKLTVQ